MRVTTALNRLLRLPGASVTDLSFTGAPVVVVVNSAWEFDRDGRAAEVDERDQGVGGVQAERAVADQADLGVEAFQASVGQAEADGGERSVNVRRRAQPPPRRSWGRLGGRSRVYTGLPGENGREEFAL